MPKAKTSKKHETKKLERPEKELFQLNDWLLIKENQTLEQPLPYVIVRTVTTYGAYEDPI